MLTSSLFPVLRRLSAAVLTTSLLALGASAWAADTDHDQHPAAKRKFNLPPSAELRYNVEAKQNGLQINGESVIKWVNASNSYSVIAETRAMLLGKVLEARSEGAVDGYGLAPASFVDKRLRREASTTTFNREQGNITFSQSSESYPINGGEQDRTSIVWQLIAVARGNAGKFTANSEWQFFVAGPRDAEVWTFKVVGRDKIKTANGEVNAVHVLRAPPPDKQGQKLDIWLAPSADWYPVRLRFTDPDEDYIEQTLASVNKQAH